MSRVCTPPRALYFVELREQLQPLVTSFGRVLGENYINSPKPDRLWVITVKSPEKIRSTGLRHPHAVAFARNSISVRNHCVLCAALTLDTDLKWVKSGSHTGHIFHRLKNYMIAGAIVQSIRFSHEPTNYHSHVLNDREYVARTLEIPRNNTAFAVLD
jgi:hypothetical protein